MGILEIYDYYVTEIADHRTQHWFLIGSPIPLIIIISSYFYFIVGYGKRYMQKRKPYSLKTFIKFYNLFQIVSNAILAYQATITIYATGDIPLGCKLVDYTNNPMSLKIAEIIWYFHMLKIIDLLETVLFLLRKKDKQISVLHLYHHVTAYILSWITVKYMPGGIMTMLMLLNSIVHVIMYTYYLCSSFNHSAFQYFSSFVKPYITRIQIIQLIVLFLHAQQGLWPSCPFPKGGALFASMILFINLVLFLKFYKDNYMKNAKVK